MKNGRRGLGVLVIAAALVAAGCAGPQQQLHQDAMQLLKAGDHDAALAKLQEAWRLDPGNAEVRIDLLNEVVTYSAALIRQGDEARANGRLDEAAALYRKALKVYPGNDRALRGLAAIESEIRMAGLLTESERLLREGHLEAARDKAKAALLEAPRNPAALQQLDLVQQQIDKARAVRAAQSAAQSVMNRPVTLQFRDANLRMVFEALSRTTGLNVILDRDVRADLKTTIFVKDASVEDTVDLILLQNQLEKRTLNANTMFVYPATAAKQKEYQDLQVRTFQIANSDVKYLQTVLKTVLKIKEVSVDDRSGTLVIRDTPEAIAVAAKVIAAHDVAEPEVMLEVAVLEVSRDRLLNLGIEFPTSLSLSTPTDIKTLGDFKGLHPNALLVSPLSATINFRLEDTDANLLASPRIRARNKEKARILIGDRVPTITNSVTPVATGSSVVTGQVQYQDVGLKLEFEPQVYSDDEVGIKINLEVSSIVREIPGPNGSLAYQIGTRNAQTAVRLRDGETQILGGLISAEDRNTAAKVPGLGQLPVLGRLFSNNSGNDRRGEIVLSITPRIIRPPAVIDASLREVFSGTESSIRQRALQLDPVGSVRTQSSGGGVGATGGGATGGGTTGAAPAAAPVRTPAAPPPAAPSPAAPSPAAPPQRPATSAPAAGAPAPSGAASGPAPAASYLRNLQQYLNSRAGGGAAPAAPPAPQPEPPAAPAAEPAAPAAPDAAASGAKEGS